MKRKLLPLELRGKTGGMKRRTKADQGNATKTLRRELLHKKAELLMSLGINSKRLTEVERTSEEDAITVVNDEFLQLSLNRVRYAELRQVESALGLLASGEHGTCAECRASISPKRLQVVPWAKYCVACQVKASDGTAQEHPSLSLQY